MIEMCGFVAGQLIAILLQWARWVNGAGWLAYWVDRKHQGRHVADACVSAVAFLGWQTGMLSSVADLIGVQAWTSKLPDTPEGLAVSTCAGFGLAFATRAVAGRFLSTKEE